MLIGESTPSLGDRVEDMYIRFSFSREVVVLEAPLDGTKRLNKTNIFVIQIKNWFYLRITISYLLIYTLSLSCFSGRWQEVEKRGRIENYFLNGGNDMYINLYVICTYTLVSVICTCIYFYLHCALSTQKNIAFILWKKNCNLFLNNNYMLI